MYGKARALSHANKWPMCSYFYGSGTLFQRECHQGRKQHNDIREWKVLFVPDSAATRMLVAGLTIDKRRMRRGSAVHHVKSGTSNACCLASEVWQADEYAKDEPGGHYSGVRALLLCRICLGWGSRGYHSSTLRIPAHPASLVSFFPHLIHITVY